MARPISMDHERVSFNLARLKKGGNNFEVVINPDEAIAYKHGKADVDLKDVLRGEKVFADAKKGELASENEMKSLFDSDDALAVADIILKEGEIQLTKEYRDQLRAEKRKRVIQLIHRNAIDPQTKLPHPVTRIENALDEVKFHFDEFRAAEEQVDEVVKKLRPVLPIKIQKLRMRINIPSQYAHQSYRILKMFGEIVQDTWGSDGSLVTKVEVPAGLQSEFIDKLNSLTHGSVNVENIEEIE